MRLTDTTWALGPLIGHIPVDIPTPHYALAFARILFTPDLLWHVIPLIPIMLSLAFAMSLKTLVTSLGTDNAAQQRSDVNREFMGQGLATMLAAIFGGTSGAAYQGTSITVLHAGGKTIRARLIAGVLTLMAILTFEPFVAQIPIVVLAGLLIAVAMRLMDAWTFEFPRRLFVKAARDQDVLADLSTAWIVTAALFVFGIFAGMGAGVIIALVLFFARMSRSGIRRVYDVAKIRSNVLRPSAEIALLEQYGHRIQVCELEGALFFGTVDQLANLVNSSIHREIDHVILDLKRVSNVDSTGALALVQLNNTYTRFNKSLVISGIDFQKSYHAFLSSLGTLDKIGLESFFATIDDALVWAEDCLLEEILGADRYNQVIGLSDVDVLDQFSAAEIEIFEQYCTRHHYKDGEVIFKQGEPSEYVLLILQGRVDIYINYDEAKRSQRIASLESGTVLGKMGILDNQPRSATAAVHHHLIAAMLPTAQLSRIEKEHPDIVFKFRSGIARELAQCLRIENTHATELRA